MKTAFTMKQNNTIVPTSLSVCMHVLGVASVDVRAMRAATTLAKLGFAVSIIDLANENYQTIEEEDIEDIHIKHMVTSHTFATTRFKKWVFFRSAWILIRSIFHLMQASADIYHALDLPALPACYIVAVLRRKPIVFEAYELPLSTLPIAELSRSRRLLQTLLAPLLKYIIPRCAGVIAVSPPIVEEIRNHYHCDNVCMIRNIPYYQHIEKHDLLRQHLGLGPQMHIALYQGNLQSDRGLEKLVLAAKYIEQSTIIVIMGKDMGAQAKITSLINREGVEDRVKIIPSVPHKELLNWTASADIGLIIYSPDYSPNVRMMLPNKLFEYLMAGLPVLTSLLDVVTGIVQTYDVGQVVTSLAPQDIGKAINMILADQDTRIRMSHNAFEAAKQEFNWEIESQYLIRLYNSVITQRERINVGESKQ